MWARRPVVEFPKEDGVGQSDAVDCSTVYVRSSVSRSVAGFFNRHSSLPIHGLDGIGIVRKKMHPHWDYILWRREYIPWQRRSRRMLVKSAKILLFERGPSDLYPVELWQFIGLHIQECMLYYWIREQGKLLLLCLFWPSNEYRLGFSDSLWAFSIQFENMTVIGSSRGRSTTMSAEVSAVSFMTSHQNRRFPVCTNYWNKTVLWCEGHSFIKATVAVDVQGIYCYFWVWFQLPGRRRRQRRVLH